MKTIRKLLTYIGELGRVHDENTALMARVKHLEDLLDRERRTKAGIMATLAPSHKANNWAE